MLSKLYLKNLKRIVVVIAILIGLVIVGIGGKLYMDNKRFNDEMINVVKSDEVKKIIELELKGLESKALTSEGKIKTYEINYESIKHNPMGGIMFRVIINQDNDLDLGFDIDKYSEGLENGSLILSGKLSSFLRE